MSDALGRLVPVDPRHVWPDEAQDFTPWLLANEDVLAQAVGMDLALKAAEQQVGDFSLDLIGTERTGDARVIVENQLGVSDHRHLGQILTYAGGVDAAYVIWLATSFRPEHRAALEWLNERTDASTGFFAVQLDVVRIGSSPPAPLLKLVVQPNDWEKNLRVATAAGGRRWSDNDFFAALAEVADQPVVDAARQLYEHARERSDRPGASWGEGKKPSMTPQIQIGAMTLQPWSFYLDGGAGGGPLFAINFEWIHKKDGRGVSQETMAAFVERLRALPNVAAHIDAAAAGWQRRPSVPAGPLFARSQALPTLIEALNELCIAARGEDEAMVTLPPHQREPHQQATI